MTDFEFHADGFADARREIQAMRERAQNFLPVWDEVLTWWAGQNRVHFGSRGVRWGKPWKELSPAYAAWKREEGWEGDILVRTSDLLRSLADRPLKVERLTRLEAVAGTNVAYARYHQTGTKYMPARPLVDADAVFREQVVSDIAANWITTGRARRS